MENQTQVSHFPTAPNISVETKNHGGEAIAPSAVAAALRPAGTNDIYDFRNIF